MQYIIIFLISILAIRTNNLIDKLLAKIPGIRFRIKIYKKEIGFEPFEYDWCSLTGDIHYFNVRIIEIGFVRKHKGFLNSYTQMKFFKQVSFYKYSHSKTFENDIENKRFIINPPLKHAEVLKEKELKIKANNEYWRKIREEKLQNKNSPNKSC